MPEVCYELGQHYEKGTFDTTPSDSRMAEIYQTACEHGADLACYEFGYRRINGLGTDRNVAHGAKRLQIGIHRNVADEAESLLPATMARLDQAIRDREVRDRFNGISDLVGRKREGLRRIVELADDPAARRGYLERLHAAFAAASA